jgi:hypothetical protein
MMACGCKGVCDAFKNILKTPGGIGNAKKGYKHGWKRCRRCGYYIKTMELRCECCHGLLKTRSMKKKIYSTRI